MSRLITQVDPLEARRIRDEIARARTTGGAKRPKPPPKQKQLVSHYTAWRTAESCHVLQLPMYFERSMWNSGGPTWVKKRAAQQQRDNTLIALRNAYRWDDAKRATVQRITFVRLSPGTLDGDDNLRSAFKYAKDAVYAWLEHGDREFNVRGIGHSDRRLARVTCSYEQRKCEANPRAHGIQIKLYV